MRYSNCVIGANSVFGSISALAEEEAIYSAAGALEEAQVHGASGSTITLIGQGIFGQGNAGGMDSKANTTDSGGGGGGAGTVGLNADLVALVLTVVQVLHHAIIWNCNYLRGRRWRLLLQLQGAGGVGGGGAGAYDGTARELLTQEVEVAVVRRCWRWRWRCRRFRHCHH